MVEDAHERIRRRPELLPLQAPRGQTEVQRLSGRSPDQELWGTGALYQAPEAQPVEPGGSNGMAIAPSNTAAHHALLLINPHTTFFFRSELQMVSQQGLDAHL